MVWLMVLGMSACSKEQEVSQSGSATVTDTTNTVTVVYAGNAATATVSDRIAEYVTVTIEDGHVRVVQSEAVGESTGEIVYALSGSSEDGSFYMEGTYKATVELHGLTLTNPSGPAIDIQNGKRIELSAKRGTVNTLTDGTTTLVDAWKGCLQCKGHLEFKGYGELTVYGHYAHGIWSKEYTSVKNCTISVLSAPADALNCNQYFLMESGSLSLSGFGDDGICVSLKSNDTSVENTGNCLINGGTVTIDMTGAGGESIKAAGTTTIAEAATVNR